MRRNGHSIRDIATALGRGFGTVSDELSHNKVAGVYDPKKSHHKAYVRRQKPKFQGMTIVANQNLQDCVERELLNFQSSAAIAGRLAAGLEGLRDQSM